MKWASRWLCLALAAACCLLPLVASAASENSRFFPETGQTSTNAFYEFWLAHGEIASLGLPISPTFRWRESDANPQEVVIQVYERAVMEWHPENASSQRVQLRRLGDNILDLLRAAGPGQRLGAILRSFPPDPCGEDPSMCALFVETNHTLRGAFLDFWNTHGGLVAFGYPITEQFDDIDPATGETVIQQYFERSRMEYHPSIGGGTILLGLLGTVFWDAHKREVLNHPELYVTVPEIGSTEEYLPATP